jgi:hypothetical protein
MTWAIGRQARSTNASGCWAHDYVITTVRLSRRRRRQQSQPSQINVNTKELVPWGDKRRTPILDRTMSTPQQQLLVDLPDGWSSRVDIKQTTNGCYAGVAELSLRGLKWGTLVFMQQPSLEAAWRVCGCGPASSRGSGSRCSRRTSPMPQVAEQEQGGKAGPFSRFAYPAHEDCQTTARGLCGTIDVPLPAHAAHTAHTENIMKALRQIIGGAISLAGAVVLVTQHL